MGKHIAEFCQRSMKRGSGSSTQHAGRSPAAGGGAGGAGHVGARGDADIECLPDPQHVPAIDLARREAMQGELIGKPRRHALCLPRARGCAGAQDHRVRAEQQGGVLDEHAVGKVVECCQTAHREARLRECPLISRMLRDRLRHIHARRLRRLAFGEEGADGTGESDRHGAL